LNLIRLIPAKGQDLVTDPVFLARLIGPIMLVLGIGMLVNRAYYRAMAEEVLANRALVILSGILIMTAGLAVVISAPQMWGLGWPLLIMIVAMLALTGGALRLVFPEQSAAFGRSMLRNPQAIMIGGIIWVVIGAILCLVGYIR
jgi:hypothetical protein